MSPDSPSFTSSQGVKTKSEVSPLCFLSLSPAAGSAEYSLMRPLTYPNTDVFLICFSVALVFSFEHLATQWYSEVNRYASGTPTLLVGLKTDLRGTVEGGEVQTPQAEELAKCQGVTI